MPAPLDVAVIGAGQAGLAVGYWLRRTGLHFALLDAAAAPGGAWPSRWDSLKLFSPAEHSSLPGRLMPPAADGGLPGRDHVTRYLADYETRYALPVERPVRVARVERDGGHLRCTADDGRTWSARTVVTTTGLRPWTPDVRGRKRFAGLQLHAADYRTPEALAGRRVLVVGSGNSGAQLVAELSEHADVTWASPEPPSYLPDDVDGRVLFSRATARFHDEADAGPPRDLGSIVVVPAVRAARERGALVHRPMVDHLTPAGAVWPDGTFTPLDAIVWATGYRPALDHLAPLGVLGPDGLVPVDGTRAITEPHLWLVGYGDWTGFASATVLGVGRSARASVAELAATLAQQPQR